MALNKQNPELEPHLTEESRDNGALTPYKHGYEPMAYEYSIKQETGKEDIYKDRHS